MKFPLSDYPTGMGVKTIQQDVVGMRRTTIHFKNKSQVTIPKEFVDQLGLKPGDLLEAMLEGDRIVLVPVVAVSRDQAWYWTKTWQDEEREVDEQIAKGNISKPMELDDALSVLEHLMERDERKDGQ